MKPATPSTLPELDDLDLSLPRSCWTCHKRKVRCDKEFPCSTCVRTGSECSYPEIPEKKKRSKRLPASAILARLAQLERKVNQINRKGAAGGRGDGKTTASSATDARTSTGTNAPTSAGQETIQFFPPGKQGDPGTLLSQGGQSRYFSDEMMASIAQDVKGFHPFSEETLLRSDKEYTCNSASQTLPPSTEGKPVPSVMQAMHLFQIFLTNVDPLIKILHLPTSQPRIYSAIQNPTQAEDSQSMLMYAICFAAVTTLDPDEVETNFSIDKTSLSKRCRDGVEQYLAKPGLMMAPNIEYLQALTIFLSLLRVSDNSRAVWIVTGLAIRIGQSLGLHKDGSIFRLPPFECEIRRRLWWQLIILDIRASEDYGLQSSHLGLPKDAPQYPGNFNDADLSPQMTSLPSSGPQFTDMSLAILRIQASDLIIHEVLYPIQATDGASLQAGIEEKRRLLRASSQRMYDTYFADGAQDGSHNVTYTAGAMLWRLSLVKSDFLLLFRASQSALLSDTERKSVRSEAVASAVSLLESVPEIFEEKAFKRFLWYPKSYPQWYAIGFILQQLYSGEVDDPTLVERAKRAIEETFAMMEEEGAEGAMRRRGAIWVALCLLKERIFPSLLPGQRRAPEVRAAIAGVAAVGTGSDSGSAKLTPESGVDSRVEPERETADMGLDVGLEGAEIGMEGLEGLDFDMINHAPFDMALFGTMQNDWGTVNDYL